MNILQEARMKKAHYNSRRHFLANCMSGLGALSLSSMLGSDLFASPKASQNPFSGGLVPKAQNVIFLHMAGAPSQ